MIASEIGNHASLVVVGLCIAAIIVVIYLIDAVAVRVAERSNAGKPAPATTSLDGMPRKRRAALDRLRRSRKKRNLS